MKRIQLIIVLLAPLAVMAQPGGGDPGGNPDVPISGIAWLVLTGGVLGARKIYQKIRKGHD